MIGEAALGAGGTASGSPPRLDDLIGKAPTKDFDLACEELLLQLDEPLRRIALSRLLGFTNDEIAVELGCTRRKIERKLALIRLNWQRHLEP